MKKYLLAIGNVYIDINFLSVETGGSDMLESGKEYIAEKFEMVPGGSAVNFVLQLSKLDFPTTLMGKTGEDEFGERFRQLIRKKGVNDDLIIKNKNVSTCSSVGMTLKSNEDNIQVVSGNANQTLSFNDIDLENVTFDEVKAVYLGGFVKQKSLFKDYPKLIDFFKKKDIRILMDHGRIPVGFTQEERSILEECIKHTEVYFANSIEVKDLTGEKNLDKAVLKVLDLGPSVFVLKMGKNGCRVITRNQDFMIPGIEVEVVNTVGAGDAFNAGFIAQYLDGKSLKDSAKFANALAAIKISKNYQSGREEVEELVSRFQ